MQSSPNVVRMFIYMEAWMSSNIGHMGSNIGQILEKSCEHSVEAIFLVQSSPNLARHLHESFGSVQNWVTYLGLKTRSPCQILEKPYDHSRSHTYIPIFTNLGHNVHLHESLATLKTGSYGVKK